MFAKNCANKRMNEKMRRVDNASNTAVIVFRVDFMQCNWRHYWNNNLQLKLFSRLVYLVAVHY